MEGLKTGYMRWRLNEYARYLRFQPDIKYKEELSEKEATLRYELSSKIDQAYLRRLMTLLTYIKKECYEKPEYTIIESRTCEHTILSNDYQLVKLNTFVDDNIFGETKNYRDCSEGPVIEKLKSIREKDDYFLECHKKYLERLEELGPELKSRIDKFFN